MDMLSHVPGEQYFEGEKWGTKSYLLIFLLQQKYLFIIKLTIIPICYLYQGQWNECISSEDRMPAFNAMQKVFKHSVNYNNDFCFLVVWKKSKTCILAQILQSWKCEHNLENEKVFFLCAKTKSAINKGNSVLSLIMEYKNCLFLQVRGVEWASIRLDCVLLQNLYFATCPT